MSPRFLHPLSHRIAMGDDQGRAHNSAELVILEEGREEDGIADRV